MAKTDTKSVNLDAMYWITLRPDQGQMVERSQPQLPGAAEGEEAAGKGLRLIFDHSDGTWDVYDRKTSSVILSGKGGACPSVREAVEARKKLRDEAS